MNKEILAIIPARGGSKRIPGKNLISLCGKPLVQYTIEAAKKSRTISRLILSSDEEKIIEYCNKQNVEIPFQRPRELALDVTPMIDVIMHAVRFLKDEENYTPDSIILLQPTSPLRTQKHIDDAVGKLIHSSADSIVSITGIPHTFNTYPALKYDHGYLKDFLPNGAIYAFTYNSLMNKCSIYGDKILPYFMKKEESIDIDDEFDLKLAEMLLKNVTN